MWPSSTIESILTNEKYKGDALLQKTFTVDLKEFDVKGKTLIKITLINNLRNLLGPHHMKAGESTRVMHSDFYKENCVWSQKSDDKWCDYYCLVNTGVEFII